MLNGSHLCCSQGDLSEAHSCTALRAEGRAEPRRSPHNRNASLLISGARSSPHKPLGGGERKCWVSPRTHAAVTCAAASAEEGAGGGLRLCLRVAACSRTVSSRDVGVSGESARGAAREQRESRGGRAVSGREALPGRALLRVQPERPVQAVQRQPVRVLQPLQKGVRA